MNRTIPLLTLSALLWALGSPAARAAAAQTPPAPAKPAGAGSAAAPSKPGVAVSTRPAETMESGVDDLYKGQKLRDPFAPSSGGGGGGAVAANAAEEKSSVDCANLTEGDFSIHSLLLKGVMEDRGGGFAVLSDAKTGCSYTMKHGRILDLKNRPVPGVTGIVKVKQKTALLRTVDNDVQTLVLGEEEITE